MRERAGEADEARELEQLAGRGVELCRSLLGFARRAPPRQAADLREVVENVAPLLRRLLPSDVTLDVALEAAGPAPGSWVGLAVRDRGAGMDAATLARCREPFFTTKPPGRGTGLGLSTVNGIVEARGGRMQIDSAPGLGTRVRSGSRTRRPARRRPPHARPDRCRPPSTGSTAPVTKGALAR